MNFKRYYTIAPWGIGFLLAMGTLVGVEWIESSGSAEAAKLFLVAGLLFSAVITAVLCVAMAAVQRALAREAQALALTDNTPASMDVKDLNGRVILVNKVCQDWYGLGEAEFLGASYTDIYPEEPETVDLVSAHEQIVLDTGKPEIQQRAVRLADGEIHNLMVAKFPIPGPDGAIVAIGSVATDVTALVQAQNELRNSRDRLEQRVEERTRELEREIKMREVAEASTRESEERFRAIAESASDWIWEMNQDLEVTYVSDRLGQILDLPSDAFIGKTRTELNAQSADPAAVAAMRAHIADLEAHRPIRNFEYALADQNGNLRMVSLSGKPMFNDNGDFLGYRGAGTDVTEIKTAEQTLLEAKETLEKRVEERTRALQEEVTERRRAQEEADLANRTKTEFLANMSHELRTPLNSIIGFADVLDNEVFGPVGNDRYRGYVGHIRDSGQHLLALINDILDVARIEVGMLELREGTVVLSEAVDSCIGMVETRARSREITIEVDLARSPMALVVDEIRFKQILLNLLTNAVKFSHPGGSVSLIGFRLDDGTVMFQVVDEGVGIAESDIPKIMQPFGQVWSAFTRTHEGTGLGLSLANALIESHGGALRIDSEVGKGTTVSITLPATRVMEKKAG